jgi:lysophospholipase L1-like esterase
MRITVVSITKNILYGLGVAVLFFGLFELIFRIAGGFNPRDYFPECFSLVNKGDITPDIDILTENRAGIAYRYTTNSLGFRSTGELLEAPEKIVLCLGDSYTFGVVDDERTYPYILQNAVAPYDIQVYNAGFSGYNLEDELSYFIDKGIHLDPDIVILGFCTNDISDYARFWRQSFKRYGSGEWRKQKIRLWLKRNLHILSFIKKMRLDMKKKEIENSPVRNIAFDITREEYQKAQITDEQMADYMQRYAADFDRLYSLCRQHGITLLPIVFPGKIQLLEIQPLTYQQFLDSLYSSYALPFIDFTPLFARHEIDSMFIEHDGHPTAFANRLVAEKLAGFLLDSLDRHSGNNEASDPRPIQ